MRYKDALRIIENRRQTQGYYVHYSYSAGSFEGYGYIPEPYLEQPFSTEEAAEAFATMFREFAPRQFHNIDVVRGLPKEDYDA